QELRVRYARSDRRRRGRVALLEHLLDRLFERRDARLDVVFVDTERRREHDLNQRSTAADEHALLARAGEDVRDGVVAVLNARIEHRLAGFGIGELDRPVEAAPADVTDDIVI